MGFFQGIIEADKQLFMYLNGFYNSFFDTLMFFITRKETWLPLYLVLVWFIFKTYRSKGYVIVLFLLIGLIASDQLSGLIKDAVQRLRPVYEPQIKDMVHNYFRMGGNYGFFSAHAANAFVLAVFTSLLFNNRLYSSVIIIWALIVSYSRIYLGVHYPLDILAGIAFGSLFGWVFYKISMIIEGRYFITRQPSIAKTSLPKTAAIIIVLVLIVVFFTLLIETRNLHHYQIL
jgi:undecaprenyl-diphosphatase